MAESAVVMKFSCDDLPKRCFTSFHELRSEKQLCDFTFKVGEVSISAHRVILAAVIPYYRNMFSKGTDEVPDVEPNILACLIDYAYTHEVSIDTNNVKSLLAGAGLLGIHEVKEACHDFLSNGFKSETLRNNRDLAGRFDSSKQLEEPECDIPENYNVISKTADSLNYPVTNFKNSADKDNRNVEDEEMQDDVLCSVINSRQDRGNSLPELLSESRKRLAKPSHLCHVEGSDSSPESRQVACSSMIQPKRMRKEEYASNEQIQKPCIYKLNVTHFYTIQRFNLLQEEWITEKDQAIHTCTGPAVLLKNKMYYFSFDKTIQYDPKDNSFEFMSCMPIFRAFYGATTLFNRIYICGGSIGNSEFTDLVEYFQPETNTWKSVTSMPTCRLYLNAVTLDECIFAIGGKCDRTVYGIVEKYEPVHNEWTPVSPMMVERWAAAAATLNGRIYVCGGMSDSHDNLSNCEVYYPIDDRWVNISPLNSARCYFTLLSFQQKLYAIGGLTDEDYIHVFEIYNPENKKWTFGPSTDEEFLTSSAFALPAADDKHGVTQEDP